MKKFKLSHFFTKKNLLIIAILILGTFLRFYQITEVPPGLYIDEAAIGYDAYSILTTGHDQHGYRYPLFFQSFGDYKTPAYIYIVSGSIAVFGKNEFAVRFPSAAAGVLTILVFYLLLAKIVQLEKLKDKGFVWLPILGAFLLAISSYHIHFSRGGFEVNFAVFLYVTGIYFASLFWEQKKMRFLLFSALLFALAVYTYQVYRILAPLTFTILSGIFYIFLSKLRKNIIIFFLILGVLIAPITLSSFTQGGSARFAYTSTFKEYHATNFSEKLAGYPMLYLKNYISFFSYNFLFERGDGNGRHQIADMGIFFKWELPFMLVGLLWLLRRKKGVLKYFVFGVLLLAPIVPSFTVPSPHSLRILILDIPLTVLVAIGFIVTLNALKKWKILFLCLFLLIASYEYAIYIHEYYFHYPIINALDWGAGEKEVAQKTQKYSSQFSHIVIDRNILYSYIYFKFYEPSVKLQFVEVSWKKPDSWKEGTTLYIRPYYGHDNEKNMIDQVLLPGPTKPVFVQFFKI